MSATPDAIPAALRTLIAPSETFEIRIIKPLNGYGTHSGYFDNIETAAKVAVSWSGKCSAVYMTLNPVKPDLLARAANRIKKLDKQDRTTTDADITARRWFPLDFDPVRPSGISSTDAEHAAAIAKAREARDWLAAQGWPAPILADSGNGAHLLYRIDLPNDEASKVLVERAIKALAHKLDDRTGHPTPVCVDQSVFNAARIWKVYGTLAAKGDSTQDRPHRMAQTIEAPDEPATVSLAQLQALAWLAPEDKKPEPLKPRANAPGGDFFSRVNDRAMSSLAAWVPALFPAATAYRDGYRVTSKALGRDLEEALSILPTGIKDFGLHDQGDAQGGKRTPVDLVIEHGRQPDAKSAAFWLCGQFGIEPRALGWEEKSRTPEPSRLRQHEPAPPLTDAAYLDALGQREPPKAKRPTLERFTAADLLRMKFPDPVWLLPDILPETGCYMLAGKPKSGKSWFALGMAMALAQGGRFLDRQTPRRKTLYLALEDTPRRLQNRLNTLHPNAPPDSLEDLTLQISAQKVGAGLENQLRQAAADGFQTIIVDTLQKVRGHAARTATQYGDDYAVIGSLKDIADECGICILVVHHLRKAESDDPHDDISGTNGIAGAADGTLILKRVRGKPDATLYVIGRDLPENELGIRFTDGLWQYAGTASEVRATSEQNEILDVLKPYGSEGATIKTICEATDKQRRNIAKLLGKLVDLQLVRVRRAKPADYFAVCDGPMSGGSTSTFPQTQREREKEINGLSTTGTTGTTSSSGTTSSIPAPRGGTGGTGGTARHPAAEFSPPHRPAPNLRMVEPVEPVEPLDVESSAAQWRNSDGSPEPAAPPGGSGPTPTTTGEPVISQHAHKEGTPLPVRDIGEPF